MYCKLITDSLHKSYKAKETGINSKSYLKQNSSVTWWHGMREDRETYRWKQPGASQPDTNFLTGQGERSGSSESGHRWGKRLTQLRSALHPGQVRDESHRWREEARDEEKHKARWSASSLFRAEAAWRIPPIGMMPITVLATLMPWGLNRRPSVHSERPDGAAGGAEDKLGAQPCASKSPRWEDTYGGSWKWSFVAPFGGGVSGRKVIISSIHHEEPSRD